MNSVSHWFNTECTSCPVCVVIVNIYIAVTVIGALRLFVCGSITNYSQSFMQWHCPSVCVVCLSVCLSPRPWSRCISHRAAATNGVTDVSSAVKNFTDSCEIYACDGAHERAVLVAVALMSSNDCNAPPGYFTAYFSYLYESNWRLTDDCGLLLCDARDTQPQNTWQSTVMCATLLLLFTDCRL